jgi:YVTN family beta-propeller protein
LLTRRSFLYASAAATLACGRRKGTGYPGYAFVANEDGHAVAAIDLEAFAFARHIRLEGSPTEVVAPPDRLPVYALTPATGAVHEIDSAKLVFRRRVQVARQALSMRVAPGRPSSLWVLCREPQRLVQVDLDHLRLNASIPLPLDPYDFDLAPDGETAVISCGESGKFGIADLTRRTCRTFDLGRKLSLVRFRADGKLVLLANAEEPALSIADARTGQLVVNLPLALRARHLCMKADGGQLFITGEGMDAVVIVYPYTTEVAETMLAGRAPGFMAECASDVADYLFVTNPESGEVTILDIDMRKVVAVVAAGRGPAFVVQTPDLQYALVLNRDSGDMAVVRLEAVAGKRDRSAPLFTMIPVGSKPVSAAVRRV